MSNTQKKEFTYPKGSIYETSTPVEPFTVGFRLIGTDIENFTVELFKRLGVEGVEAARLQPQTTGSTNPRLSLHVFISKKSGDIISHGIKNNIENVNPLFLNKMNTGGMHASKRLKEAFTGLMLDEGKTKVYNTQKSFVYIPIDPIKLIGAMVAARPGSHFVNIASVEQFKNTTVVTAFKTQLNNEINPGRNQDQYTAVLNNNNQRRR